MGLGILDVRDADVPGTATLQQLKERTTVPGNHEDLRHLKHDTSGKVPILLVPQPSDDPNDPLNLPRWRRDLIVFILSLFAVIATTLSPILACDSLVLAFQYELTFTKIALLTGWHLLAVGVSGIFFVPFATVFGKRHLYLLGACLTCASCAWAGSVTDSYAGYKSLIGARVLQGVGLAPFEALVNVSVGDLFYVHERGSRMALSNLALFGGAFFTPVIAGVITDSLGWRWTFKFVAIFSGALIPFVFFFVPETAFRREALPEATGFETAYSMPTTETQAKDGSRTIAASAYEPKYPAPAIIPAKKTFAQTLSPFDGRKTDDNLLKLIFRPFPLFLQPGILWACLIQGTLIGWTVMIGIVLAAIFLGPPLYFTELQVGYMYAGPFVGALVGFAICGLIANPSVKWLTRWNNGVYEPEFRMVLVIPQLILGGIGLYGFGYTASNQFEYGWAGPTVLFGFEVAGMVCGAVASALYIADAHPDIAVAAFTCVLMFKNLFSFGLTVHGYDWLVERTTFDIFIIISSVQVGVCCLTIPMYVFGKWNRHFWAKFDFLKLLRLK